MAAVSGLSDYLRAASRAPWEWSVMDSFMFAGGWIEARTGLRVTDEWRGRYGSCEEACALILARFGSGPIDASRRVLREHGIERTRVPMPGDVAIVVDRTPEGTIAPTAAICLDRRTRCIKTRRGVAIVRARTLIAWKLPHG